jgi:hypothetical protein
MQRFLAVQTMHCAGVPAPVRCVSYLTRHVPRYAIPRCGDFSVPGQVSYQACLGKGKRSNDSCSLAAGEPCNPRREPELVLEVRVGGVLEREFLALEEADERLYDRAVELCA